jgi:multiple sugar transport system permease protein
MKRKLFNIFYPYLFLLPAFIILFVVLAYPWLNSLYLSFHSYRPSLSEEINFVGLENYYSIFKDKLFEISTYNTTFLLIGEISIQFILGLLIALSLNSIKSFQRFFRTVALLPLVLAPALSSLAWRFLVDPVRGFINGFLLMLGIKGPDWIGDPNYALLTVLVIEVWKFTPYVTLILLAGLQGIPPPLLEAAAIDGASRWQSFRYVTFPWLKPFIAIALLFRTMFVLRTFEIIYLLMGLGGPGNSAMVYGTYLVYLTRKLWDLGLGSAMSIILVVITGIISIGYFMFLYKGEG